MEEKAKHDPAVSPVVFGKILHQLGFKTWFLYFFNTINNNKFHVDEIHNDLFCVFQDIYNMKSFRDIINIPPRSGKTTMASYFIAYCLAVNPACNFIYTSYSQSLLSTISHQVRNILEHKLYKLMYSEQNTQVELKEENPVNEFWQDYALLETNHKKNTYTSTKITTSHQGIILFVSTGSSITGFGAGSRIPNGRFTGALIIDDGNKPSDINSNVMREKVHEYYTGTLLSRLNNPYVPIINIQQRLHKEDLTGFLLDTYKIAETTEDIYNLSFNLCKKRLVEDGILQIPSQYTQQRVKELKQGNSSLWETQYQQNPVDSNDIVIKSEYFNYYHDSYTSLDLQYIFMTTDVAFSEKTTADYTCLIVWGKGKDGKVYLIDMQYDKIPAKDLTNYIYNFYSKYKQITMDGQYYTNINKVYIESNRNELLIADLGKRIPQIETLKRDSNSTKISRVNASIASISNGWVVLPSRDDINDNIKTLLKECQNFRLDMTHKHDDIVDNITDAVLCEVQNQSSMPDYTSYNQMFKSNFLK